MNTNLFLVLDLVAKSVALLLLAFAVQVTWRGASASQRCVVWMTTFGLLALLPISIATKPVWTLQMPQEPTRSVVMESFPAPTVSAPVQNEDASPQAEIVVTAQRQHWGASEWSMEIWLFGAALVLGYRLVGSVQLMRLRLSGHASDDERASRMLVALAAELGIRRGIALRTASWAAVPMTWGTIKPVVILPYDALAWTDARLAAALRHELGHVRHFDALSRLFMTLVCAFQWPNPLLWLAARSWRTAQEQACDDLVLRAGASAEDYADQLLQAAQAVNGRGLRLAPALAMARSSTLATRLQAVLDADRNRHPLSPVSRFIGVAVIGGLSVLSSLVQLSAEEKAPTPSAASDLSASHSKPSIGIDIKVIGVTPEAFKALFEKHPSNTFSATESGDIVQTLVKNGTSYERGVPHILTPDSTELGSGNVVTWGDPKDVAARKRPELLIRKGHECQITPRMLEGGAVRLEGMLYSGAYDPTQTPPMRFETTLKPGESWIKELVGHRDSTERHLIVLTSTLVEPEAKVTTAATFASSPDKYSIGLESHFIEAPEGTGAKLPSMGDPGEKAGGLKQILVSHLPAYLRKLSDTDGVGIISSPKVSTRSGNKATITMGKELSKEAGTKNAEAAPFVGTKLEFLPKLDGNHINFSIEVSYTALVGMKDGRPELTTSRYSGSAKPSPNGTAFFTSIPSTKGKELIVFLAPSLQRNKDEPQPEKSDAVPQTLQKAQKLIVNTLQLNEMKLSDAIEFLRVKSREADPDKTGINIVFKDTRPAVEAKITLSLKNVTINQALNYVAQLGGLEAHYENDAVTLAPPGEKLVSETWGIDEDLIPKDADAQAWLASQGVKFPPGASAELHKDRRMLDLKLPASEFKKLKALVDKTHPVPPPSATQKAAEAIVIPEMDFKEANVTQLVEFLNAQGHAHDPAKNGVNIVLKGQSPAKLTLRLKNVSLWSALQYVSALAGLELKADAKGIVLKEPPPEPPRAAKPSRTDGASLKSRE